MAEHSKIEWTDATWNPVTGCSVVSPGCTNCYAMKLAGTRLRHHPSHAGLTVDTKAGPVWTGEVRLNEGWIDQPLRWRRPRRIFVCAHGDLFHELVPEAWIDRVFREMGRAPHHTFQVLTKRAQRMRDYMSRFKPDGDGWVTRDGKPAMGEKQWGPIFGDDNFPPRNLWLGVSVEDQARADARIPDLLATPAAVRFVSAEPLLGPIKIRNHLMAGCDPGCCASCGHGHGFTRCPNYGGVAKTSDKGNGCSDFRRANFAIAWVIVGGESGPGARPMHPDWARSIIAQCRSAGIACFIKQLGAATGFNLHSRAGSDPAEWPADLRLREFPQ